MTGKANGTDSFVGFFKSIFGANESNGTGGKAKAAKKETSEYQVKLAATLDSLQAQESSGSMSLDQYNAAEESRRQSERIQNIIRKASDAIDKITSTLAGRANINRMDHADHCNDAVGWIFTHPIQPEYRVSP